MMIDNPGQVYGLVARLKESLPLAAHLTPELTGTLRGELGYVDVPAACQIGRVDYAGDEGGIMCKLEFDRETGEGPLYVSITHLHFFGRSPLTRDIVAYQKRRLKHLRRQYTIA